jgi:Ca2+-binding RTX toxin-like protein
MTLVGRATLVALAIGSAAVMSEGVARAAVTTQFANGTLTVTGDDASDAITLGVSGPLITHNLSGFGSTDFDPGPGTLELPSNATVALVVNAGGGNDNINVSAPNFAGAPVINGGDGDDTIVGSLSSDTIDGGNGSDRITGGRNLGGTLPELINGGAGNDVMLWSNGDGSDTHNGGPGIDETQIVSGTSDDVMTVDQVAGGTRFARANAPFTVDMQTVERLSVASAAGNDRLTAAPGVPIALTVDGGPGNDVITTGAGADQLDGGVGNDVLDAGAGDDRVLWEDGDGADAIDGDDGFDRVEASLSGADDTVTLTADGGAVRFRDSTIASSEALALSALAGNDTIMASPGVALALLADGGAGDDRLSGTDAADTLSGGTGDDQLAGGAGNDVVDGGDGQDALALRDGQADVGRGGPGSDSAVADVAGLDTVDADVESVDRPPLPPAPVATAPVVVDAPPAPRSPVTPRIRLRYTAGWTVFEHGVRIEALMLKDLTAGTKVEVSCSVCRRKQALTAKSRVLRLRHLPSKALKRGQRLVLTATRPGAIGQQIVLTVKRYGHGKKALGQASVAPFRERISCLPANSATPQAAC